MHNPRRLFGAAERAGKLRAPKATVSFIGELDGRRLIGIIEARSPSVRVQMQSAVNAPARQELADAKVKMEVFAATRATATRGPPSCDGSDSNPGRRQHGKEWPRQRR